MSHPGCRPAGGPRARPAGAHRAPQPRRGGRGGCSPLKIYYATQVSTRPPTVALFVNYPEVATEAYLRHLEARLRERFDFEGTPIRFVLRARRPRGEARA
ncbi:MAG: GTP-binding protein [candidate division GAL15 bacterium]